VRSQSTTLTATGGVYYIWNNGVVNGSPFNPATTSTYVVSGADSSNCVNSDTVMITVNQPTTSSLTVNALDQYTLNGTVYTNSGTYTQVIQNAAGCDSTITLTLTLDFTGLNETNKLNFSWFPNPTSDVLNVEVDEAYLGETLHFYSADGRLVQTVVLSEEILSIDVKELTNGSYVCRLTNEANVVFRWIKN
jgi:hypothetical protein